MKDGSDTEILKDRIGLLKLVLIEQELSDKLGITVDLVTENAVKTPRLKNYIQQTFKLQIILFYNTWFLHKKVSFMILQN